MAPGYPGDFETIEWLWRGDNRAPAGTLAHAIETYALNAAIAQQHRNKVAFQAACMLQALATARPCRVLSIGCGGNPDLRTVIDSVPSSASFVLCDSDKDALSYSRAKLGPIADQCHLVHGMVPRVLRRVRDHGPFDLILAGGLFDYLSDRFIARTLSDAWGTLLAPGGRIVFTNIACGNPFRVWIEDMADWRLIERSEEDIATICREAGIPVVPTMVRDATSLAIVATSGGVRARSGLITRRSFQVRASRASEPRERSAPAQRRARARVGESEGRSPRIRLESRLVTQRRCRHRAFSSSQSARRPLDFLSDAQRSRR